MFTSWKVSFNQLIYHSYRDLIWTAHSLLIFAKTICYNLIGTNFKGKMWDSKTKKLALWCPCFKQNANVSMLTMSMLMLIFTLWPCSPLNFLISTKHKVQLRLIETSLVLQVFGIRQIKTHSGTRWNAKRFPKLLQVITESQMSALNYMIIHSTVVELLYVKAQNCQPYGSTRGLL